MVPAEGGEGSLVPGLSPWLVDGHLPVHWGCLCGVCVQVPFCTGHHTVLGLPYRPHRNLITSVKTFSLVRSHSEVPWARAGEGEEAIHVLDLTFCSAVFLFSR